MSETAVAAPAQSASGNYITHEQMTTRDLQSQVKSLTDQLATANGKVTELTSQIGTLETERDGFAELVNGIEAAAGSIEIGEDGSITIPGMAQSAETIEPSEWEAKYNELIGQNRERDHRDGFNKVAGELDIVDPEAAWALSGYKPEGDAPDAEAIKATLTTLLEKKSYLKKPAPAPSPAPSPAEAMKARLTLNTPQAISGTGLSRGTPEAATKPASQGIAEQARARMVATGRTGNYL